MLDLSGIPLSDILPSWAMYHDVERVEWVNTIISRLWPTITGYFKKIVRDKIYHKVIPFRLKNKLFCLQKAIGTYENTSLAPPDM